MGRLSWPFLWVRLAMLTLLDRLFFMRIFSLYVAFTFWKDTARLNCDLKHNFSEMEAKCFKPA